MIPPDARAMKSGGFHERRMFEEYERMRKIHSDKKKYLSLLLLGDEQEDMIDRYLERGTMYILEEKDGEGISDQEICQDNEKEREFTAGGPFA